MTSAAGSETPAVDYRRKPGKGEPSGHPLSLWVKLENMRKTGGTRGCQITKKTIQLLGATPHIFQTHTSFLFSQSRIRR